MTGPEHYRKAERLVKDEYRTAESIAAAQVHATLALVAAQVEHASNTAILADFNSLEIDRWLKVTHGPAGGQA